MFLTRIPCPSWACQDPDTLANAALYFPVIGLLVGAVSALAYGAAALFYASQVAALAGLAAAAVVTGAFHEDAFADLCDSFGGRTPEKRMAIMRDSRVGAFGVVGLVLLLGLKASLLASLSIPRALTALITAHVVARWSSLILVMLSPGATDAGSLAKGFDGGIPLVRLAVATLFTAIVCLWSGPVTAVTILLLTVLLCTQAGRFFRGWIGGLSGDCIGAVIQLTELLCYAVLVRAPALEHLLHGGGRPLR